MHCDYRISLFVLSLLAVSARAYTTEELHAVNLTLDVPFSEYEQNPDIQNTLFELVANYSSINCTATRQNCKLVAKYYRNTGPYKRDITTADYQFSAEGVAIQVPAERWVDALNSSITGTDVVFYLKTKTGYDYLKWTELVRLLYYHTPEINEQFYAITNITQNIVRGPPTSYIAKLIDENITIPAIIACVILGSAIILFIVLIPLSNTKHCRKELDDSIIEEVATESA